MGGRNGPIGVVCGPSLQYQLRRCLDIHCSGHSKRTRLCPNSNKGTNCRSTSQLHEIEGCQFENQIIGKYQLTHYKQSNSCNIQCYNILNGSIHDLNSSRPDASQCQFNSNEVGICLEGKCNAVGCDNIIGSTAKVDACGKCSIFPNNCQPPTPFAYSNKTQFSGCDKSCGPERYRVSVSVCVNTNTDKPVPDRFCANLVKPLPIVEKCEYIVCPAKWITGSWNECSSKCGGGTKTRQIFCVESHNETLTPLIPQMFRLKRESGEMEVTNRQVTDNYCWQSKRPVEEKACNLQECARYSLGDWSTCSVTCENGIRTRNVQCKQEGNVVDETECEGSRPTYKKPCYTGLPCPKFEPLTIYQNNDMSPRNYNSYSLLSNNKLGPWQPKNGFQNDASYLNGKAVGEDDGEGVGYTSYDHNGKSEPHYSADPWSPCSTSCGPGIKTRQIYCIGSRRMGSDSIRLPEYECEGKSMPQQFIPCQDKVCPPSDEPYALEGKKEPSEGTWYDINAISSEPKKQPTPTQNKVLYAPANFDIGPWSECSHHCGKGKRTRKVRCTKSIDAKGVSNSQVILEDDQCFGQMPSSEEDCGLVDCQINWKAEKWTDCSSSCGAGEQRRQVICQQIMANGKLRIFDTPSLCQSIIKPPTVQLCNLGSCESKFKAQLTYQTYQDNEPAKEPSYDAQDSHHKKLTLNVGGYANLYEGTSLKIKCPVKDFNKAKIVWTKEGKVILNNEHMKVSTNGALRIFHSKMADAGVYACIANGIQGNVTLAFKHKHRDTSEPQLSLASPSDVDRQLLMIVKEGVKKSGDGSFYKLIANLREPGRIKADFAIGEWSGCSQGTCGGGVDGVQVGVQVRAVKCQLRYKGQTTYCEDLVCEQFGVIKVPATRSCQPENCPFWEGSDWSECAQSRCFKLGTAVQKREIKCLYSNKTEADINVCDRKSRPKVKKECVNVSCQPNWVSSQWGGCSRKCGEDGVQMRILKCVWHGTKKPAGRQCSNVERPTVIRSCNKVPCSNNIPEPPPKQPANGISRSWRGWHLYKWNPEALDAKRLL
uniref:Ig-like domain-containing protein n=1 Tax=Rhabditophanes sp. KR3021 TaxID=114890 RepID=A0AC35TFQ6_9BILA